MALDGYSEYLQVEVHKWIFGQSPDAMPGTFYIALSTTIPEPDASGVTEPSAGANYARAIITNLNFSAPGTIAFVTTTTNDVDITFNESTAGWGTIQAFAAFSAASGLINMLFGGVLDQSKLIEANTIAVFSTGDLKLSTKNTP